MSKEYIERDALIAEYDRVHVGAPGGARKLMEDAPAADVVEVVRCRECKHARAMNSRESEVYVEGCVVCSKMDMNGELNPMFADDYCSCGERKDTP